jgi:tRNA(Ile)-lysidine synthase
MIKLILNYLALERDAADFDKVERICASIVRKDRSNVTFDVAGSILFTREYDTILLHTMVLPNEAFSCQLHYGDAQAASDGWSIACQWLAADDSQVPQPRGRMELTLDCDRVAFPLTVRSRIPGDRISVAGLNGSKKVKDIFIDEKVPPAERERVPIVADSEDRLIWVAGYRRSDLARVTGETRRILYMKLSTSSGLYD